MVKTINLIKRPKPQKNILNNREFSEFDSSNSVFCFFFNFNFFLSFSLCPEFFWGVAVFFKLFFLSPSLLYQFLIDTSSVYLFCNDLSHHFEPST